MTRYLIILSAVLAGVLIGWLLSRPKKPAADEVLVEDKPVTNLWPFVGGLIVLALGLFYLAGLNRAPIEGEYNPAVIDGGAINPGHFNQDHSGQDQSKDQPKDSPKTSGAEEG